MATGAQDGFITIAKSNITLLFCRLILVPKRLLQNIQKRKKKGKYLAYPISPEAFRFLVFIEDTFNIVTSNSILTMLD